MIEKTILSNLIQNEEYIRKVVPYLKPEYFHDYTDRKIFSLVFEYFEKYNRSPSGPAVLIDLSNADDLTEEQHTSAKNIIEQLEEPAEQMDWLLDQTEKFCQDKAIYNAIMESIQVIDGKSDKGKGALPTILADALAVNFDPHIGHDLIEDADARYEWYHQKEEKVKFDLDLFNEITDGGLSNKTLNIG